MTTTESDSASTPPQAPIATTFFRQALAQRRRDRPQARGDDQLRRRGERGDRPEVRRHVWTGEQFERGDRRHARAGHQQNRGERRPFRELSLGEAEQSEKRQNHPQADRLQRRESLRHRVSSRLAAVETVEAWQQEQPAEEGDGGKDAGGGDCAARRWRVHGYPSFCARSAYGPVVRAQGWPG
jgi:hypothetical protein